MENLGFSGGKRGSMREAIISILGIEFPLTARKIYNILRKREGFEVTYQAVHKTLRAMVEEGVLEKNIKEYRINKDWISKMKDFAQRLEARYSESYMDLPSYEELTKEKEMKTFIFDCLRDTENYRKRLHAEYLLRTKSSSPYCGYTEHLRSPLVYSEKTLGIVNIINRNKRRCYLLVSGNSPIDKWGSKYYESAGVHMKIGLKSEKGYETMEILGNIIVQLYMPEEMRNDFNELYKKAKSMVKVNIPEFYKKFYERPIKIKLVMTNNPEIAEQLRNDIINEFKKK